MCCPGVPLCHDSNNWFVLGCANAYVLCTCRNALEVTNHLRHLTRCFLAKNGLALAIDSQPAAAGLMMDAALQDSNVTEVQAACE